MYNIYLPTKQQAHHGQCKLLCCKIYFVNFMLKNT